MALNCPTRPLAELHLHPALDFLARDIEAYSAKLDISVDDLCPVRHPVLLVTRDDAIIGNWPGYRAACRQRLTEVPVKPLLDLVLDDPDIATLRTVTSVCRPHHADPLLLGLAFRHWRRYENCMVPLRASGKVNQFHFSHYGMSRRDFLHRELERRLGRSIRGLQRFDSILDVPPVWLQLHRAGRVPLQVLEPNPHA